MSETGAIQAYPLVASSIIDSDGKNHYSYSLDDETVDGMTWDRKRHGLWLTGASGRLFFLSIAEHSDILEQFHSVASLAVFPPGVLPICISYVGNGCGSLKRIADLTEWFDTKASRERGDVWSGMPTLLPCVDPKSGVVFIAGGCKFILQYDPNTKRVKKRFPQVKSKIKWDHIASNGLPEGFLLHARSGYYYRWTAPICDESSEAQPLWPGGLNRVPVASSNGIMFAWSDLETGRLLSLHLDRDYGFCLESEEKFMESSPRVHPMLVGSSDPRVQCIYMFNRTHITCITPQQCKQGEVWKSTNDHIAWRSHNGADSEYYSFAANGMCNGIQTMFFPTHHRVTVDYLDLPRPSPLCAKKRKRNDNHSIVIT